MTELTIELPEDVLQGEGLSGAILVAAALELYQLGKLSSERAAELADLSHKEFLREAGEELPVGQSASVDRLSDPVEPDDSLCGSRYLARVLWGLREAEKRGMGSQTAADLAKFISESSKIRVEGTNTARFFRECRTSGKFEVYWEVTEVASRRRYQLSEAGRVLLEGVEASRLGK